MNRTCNSRCHATLSRHGRIAVIGFAESLAAPEVTWSLTDAGFRVVAFARRGKRCALRGSKYATVVEVAHPELDVTESLSDLSALLSSVSIHSAFPVVLMPIDDTSVYLCNSLPPLKGVVVAGPLQGLANLALDKSLQMDLARSAGFQVPQVQMVRSASDICTESLSFPVVFKPALAVARVGSAIQRGRAWFCSSRKELAAAVSEWGETTPMLLQQYVEGTGEGLFGLARDGTVVAWTAHRRLRMMNPQGSGSSACLATQVSDDARQMGEKFISDAKWNGLFMLELLRDALGNWWFMELNGRAWGSMALARRQGFEYPAWAAAIVADPTAELSVPESPEAPMTCRHLGREILHVAFVIRGPKSTVTSRWPSRWATMKHVFRIHRSDRWYNWRRDDKAVFVSDLLASVLFR